MTTAEAAERLGLNVGTVRLQIAKGKLRARKVGRDWNVAPSEVERYRRDSLGQAKGAAPKRARRPAPFLAPAIAAAAPAIIEAIRAEVSVPAFCPAPKPSARKRRKVSAE